MSKSQEIIPHHVDKGAETPKFNEDFFSCKQGTAADFFPDSVRTTLNDYEANPQGYSAEEELVILSKMNLGLSFEQPGIADEDGAWIVADQLKRIARSKDFHFVSELGRRYAKYCDDADQLAFSRSLEDGDFQKMYSVGYSADRGGFGAVSSWGSDVKQYTYATAETDDHDQSRQQYISTLNSPAFQSFLAREFAYSTADFGKEFPIGLFVKFMEQQDPNTYEVSVRRMRELPETIRPTVAEAFLATEFGDDFGDTLLTVAEKLPQEQLVPLLDKIQSIREYGAKFAKEFSGFDGKINNSIKAAIGERITEVLYVVKELAITVEGMASGKVLGNRITVKNMVEVMDALSLIELGLQRKSEAEESGVVTSAYDEDNRTAWHLGTESDVLVQVKKRGERRGEYKKGLEHSEEAQINYSIDVLSRDGDYVPTQIANYRRRYALSIRLDLEGILRDKNGGKIGFDATHDQLTAALDMGSLRGAADNPNVRVARIISLGNKLRKRDLRQGRSLGYHTGLPEEYGNKVKFAGLAEFMIAKYRHRALGRGVVASALDQSSHQSSVSRSERVAA